MLNVSELYDRKYDMAERTGEPVKTIMLATIPRTGSTYLCLRMWSEGVFGAPLEYLNSNFNSSVRRLSRGTLSEHWRQVKRMRQTPNGVFSYKMFVANYYLIKDFDPDFLQEIAPSYVVYLTREDKVAQAISFARAIQTGLWFAGADCPQPEYCFEAIHEQEKSIADQEATWEAIFNLTGTAPFRITYEQVLVDCESVIEGLANFVGEPRDGDQRIELPSIQKQADFRSENWRCRYLEERSRLNSLGL